jgi:hypothetical protein
MRYRPALNTGGGRHSKIEAGPPLLCKWMRSEQILLLNHGSGLTSSGTAGRRRQRTTETAPLGRPKEKAKPWCPPSLAASDGEKDLFALLFRAGHALTYPTVASLLLYRSMPTVPKVVVAHAELDLTLGISCTVWQCFLLTREVFIDMSFVH